MREQIIKEIRIAANELFSNDVSVVLERPEPQFGDFATNVAMQLAKPLGRNPREIAQQLAEKLNKSDIFSSVGVAGPGFINMTLTEEQLVKSLESTPAQTLSGLKVLIEYSDPNPFKPLHAGHLYTTLVGDSISRFIENSGAEVVRLSYGGDVGMHVGKTMWAVMRFLGDNPQRNLESISESERPNWLGRCYVEGNDAFEEPESKPEIIEVNKKVYALHSSADHESDFAQIYWSLRSTSYDFFKKLYTELQVKEFDRFIPESEVTQLGIDTLQQQKEAGIFEESDGAVVFDGEAHGLHTRVFMNSEGLPTYEAKELGLIQTKWNDYKYDQSIIITANEQQQYMQVVMKAVEQFNPDLVQRTRHLTHGVVKLSGGVKMSSRKGNILSAFDVLQAAREAGSGEAGAITEEVMLAAVKYAMLKNRIGGDIVYDPAESVATEGNSGPYLQYAHARACSIINKADGANTALPSELTDAERSLVRKLSDYSETVEQATLDLSPHHLCTYLYELCQEFNRFYEKSKVIGDARESQRLYLVKEYAAKLETGLGLLGIVAPGKM